MRKNNNSALSILGDGIIFQNPVLIQLLGMCPTLATSTSLKNGIGMGLAATAVLTGSNFVISLLRKYIPEKIRIASYVVIISGFVTAIEMLMKAYVPALSVSLGLYIPLIVVNCIILARAESFASKNSIFRSVLDGIGMGLGFTLALCILSVIREFLSNGTIYGINVPIIELPKASLFAQTPGGFLTLGLLIALVQKLTQKKEDKA